MSKIGKKTILRQKGLLNTQQLGNLSRRLFVCLFVTFDLLNPMSPLAMFLVSFESSQQVGGAPRWFHKL
jgi:hypothetical protein